MSGEVFGAELHEVRGPSALGSGGRRFFDLLFLISVTEFKKTYFGTVLGYVWSLIRPLTLFGAALRVHADIPDRLGGDQLSRPAALQHRRVHLLSGGDQQSRHLGRGPGGSSARHSSPAS